MEEEEFIKRAEQYLNDQNHRPIDDFDGYSPLEMHYLLYEPFSEESPFKLKKLPEQDYQNVPIFNQVKYLGNLISKHGELKLTAKGFLSTKVVADIYAQGFIKEEAIENGITKLYKETDAMCINLAHLLPKIAGLVKKRHGKLSLTKKGEKIFSDDFKLLNEIFQTFAKRFNWAYYDGYGDNPIGQLGFAFTLILLSKYGDQKRNTKFYAQKYFNAFPHLFDSNRAYHCYTLRTFDRFLDYFGVISLESDSKSSFDFKDVTKMPLFDKMFECKPPINST